MKLSTLKPPDDRMRVPCTALPSVIAKLQEQGQHVTAMDRKRDRGQTDYLLTVHPMSVLRDFKTNTP